MEKRDNNQLISAVVLADSQLRAAKASSSGITNADLNAAEKAIKELREREKEVREQSGVPDPILQRALATAIDNWTPRNMRLQREFC